MAFQNFVNPEYIVELKYILNFVQTPQKFNKTEVEASIMQWERSMLWREFWFKKDQNAESESESIEEEDCRESIFIDTEISNITCDFPRAQYKA